MLRWLVLLLVVAGVAVYFGWLPLDSFKQIDSIKKIGAKPQAMYRWVDGKGGVHYGNEYPAGVKAEPVKEGSGTVSVVPATKIVEQPKKQDQDGVTLQQKIMDRAIEGVGK